MINPHKNEKEAINLSFNVFSTRALIEDTVICVSSWRRDQHFNGHLNQVKV